MCGRMCILTAVSSFKFRVSSYRAREPINPFNIRSSSSVLPTDSCDYRHCGSCRYPAARFWSLKLETGNSKLEISIRLLLHDVNINRRRVAQEAMHGRHEKVFAPAAGCGMSENHLRDVLLADELRHRLGLS